MYQWILKKRWMALLLYQPLVTTYLCADFALNPADLLTTEAQKEYLLEITLNGVTDPEPVLSYVKNEIDVYIPLEFFKKHHVKISELSVQENHVLLNKLPWIETQLDLKQQKIFIKLPPDKFEERLIQVTSSHEKRLPLNFKDSGFYLNYDASLQHIEDKRMRAFGALNEAVYFTPQGVGSFSHLLNDSMPRHKFVRLDTNWTVNKPDEQATWRYGDSVTRAGDWGGSVRFAGIQWSTNFAIQPNFVTFPLPSVKGQASLPSTIDIFVNDALQQNHKVDPGVFGVNDLPVVTGQGQVSLVTQDILGRRQEIVIPYYISPELLKPGLSDFSFEGGFIRENYGLQSFTYGKPLGIATYRQGLTSIWTSGIHSEVTSQFQNVGITNQIQIADWALLNNSIAFSTSSATRNSAKQGLLYSLGLNRQTSSFSFGIKGEITQGQFLRVGNFLSQQTPWLTFQGFAGYSLNEQGSVSVSYSERRQKKMAPFRFITTNYQRSLTQGLSLSVGFSSSLQRRSEQQLGIFLMWMMGERTMANSQTQLQRKKSTQSFFFQKSLPVDTGIGYRIQTSHGAQKYYSAEVETQEDYGNVKVRASRDQNINNVEVNARGSVIRFGEATFFSRSLSDSFGLVQAPGLKEVAIYSNNQFIGKTDEKGNLIIPYLTSYQPNEIRIEPKNLPLSMSIASPTVPIIPAARCGVIAAFKVEAKKTIVFRLKDPTGEDCPAGTLVEDEATGDSYRVGLEGEVCLQISTPKKEIKLKVHLEEPCTAFIKIPSGAEAEDILNLEDQKCQINP